MPLPARFDWLLIAAIVLVILVILVNLVIVVLAELFQRLAPPAV